MKSKLTNKPSKQNRASKPVSVRVQRMARPPGGERAMLIRDPMVTWYGPHACEKCGRTVIKTGNGAPELTLDAENHDHHYPNFHWCEHQCAKAA
jgi:hypothetical protein